MQSKIIKREGKKLIVEIEMDLEGDMLMMEEQIQKAVNEAGKLATKEAIATFDTDGSPLKYKGKTYRSKGKKKKR